MTEELDNRLHEALSGGRPAERSEEIGKEAVRMNVPNTRSVRVLTWIGMAIGSALVAAGIVVAVIGGEGGHRLIIGGLLVVAGLALYGLVTVWYWIEHHRSGVQAALTAARNEEIKRDAVRWFGRKELAVRIIAWIFVMVSCVLILGGSWMVVYGGEGIRTQISGAMLFAGGLAMNVLIKLWYWVVHARLSIQKDLAEIRAQVAELAAQAGKTTS